MHLKILIIYIQYGFCLCTLNVLITCILAFPVNSYVSSQMTSNLFNNMEELQEEQTWPVVTTSRRSPRYRTTTPNPAPRGWEIEIRDEGERNYVSPYDGDIIRTSTPPSAHPSAKAAVCLLYTSPSPRDKRQSRMPSSA